MDREQNLFYEEQKIPTIAKIIMLIGCAAIIAVLIVSMLQNDDETKAKSLLILTTVNSAIIGLAAIAVLYTKLIVYVDKDFINIRFYPFMLKSKKLPIKNLQRYYVRKYRPFMEYGGWGIRWNSNGRAYSIKGNMAIQLEFKSGSKILIGTQKPDDFKKAFDCNC